MDKTGDDELNLTAQKYVCRKNNTANKIAILDV